MTDVPLFPFGQVTVLAPGLLGASVLMAAKERQPATRTVAWARREETRNLCAQQPWCDAVYETPQEAVANADIVVLCPPVEHIIDLLKTIAPHLKPGAIVTDVGSTKASICAQAEAVALPKDCAFVGSHPMAGSEKTGLENGRADLFDNRACLVVEPDADALPHHESFQRTCVFWRHLGMRVFGLSAQEHDRLVAETSHLPHLLASALSAWLDRDAQGQARRNAAGPGLRDTTRIAAGDPDLWLSIVRENRAEITTALEGFLGFCTPLLAALKSGDDAAIHKLLADGKTARDLL